MQSHKYNGKYNIPNGSSGVLLKTNYGILCILHFHIVVFLLGMKLAESNWLIFIQANPSASQSVLIGENVSEKLVKMLKSIYFTESYLYAQIDCIQTINGYTNLRMSIIKIRS